MVMTWWFGSDDLEMKVVEGVRVEGDLYKSARPDQK